MSLIGRRYLFLTTSFISLLATCYAHKPSSHKVLQTLDPSPKVSCWPACVVMFGILKPPSPRETPAPQPATPPPSGSMAPVPAAHFNSSDKVKQYAKDWAKTQGYAIVINRSRQNRLWLKCDRGGKYEDRHNLTEANRKRKRGER